MYYEEVGMTSRIRAIQAYRPRIVLNQVLELEDLAEYIKRGTALNKGEIINVLTELSEAVSFYALQGTPVRFPGLGIFKPVRALDGEIRLGHRIDRRLYDSLNAKGAGTFKLVNGGNAGLSAAELIEMWNTEHPDDPVEEPLGEEPEA